MTDNRPSFDYTSFREVVGDDDVADQLKQAAPTAFDAVSEFWRAPMISPHLETRVKELILLAMHASATSLNTAAVRRHIDRAKASGATDEDIVDVLVTVVALANHALYSTVPIVEEEIAASRVSSAKTWEPDAEFEKSKAEFIESRGFWNPDRELLAKLMPDYLRALTAVSTETWRNGSLTTKDRELVCIGIDSMITHIYEPGLRRHVRNALKAGATHEELLEVLQLAGLLGLEGVVLGAHALFGEETPSPPDHHGYALAARHTTQIVVTEK